MKTILRGLVASRPGQHGKWFAVAVAEDAGFGWSYEITSVDVLDAYAAVTAAAGAAGVDGLAVNADIKCGES